MSRIHLSVPHLSGEEEQLLQGALASNWVSTVGPEIDAFEREMGERLGRHAVAVSSGTAALHLGLRLLGVGPGDEVICPTLTFVAAANVVRYLGAEPVFVDSEYRTWNMDPQQLEDALEARHRAGTRPTAIIAVDLYGQPVDADALHEVAVRYGVPVLEDAAEALGARYKERPAGTLAPVSALSFNGNKIITAAGGGMLLTEDRSQADKARFWATQARDPGISYEHSELGYNYRLSNLLAAVGRGQLHVLDDRVQRRRAIAFRYRDAFADLEGLELMPQPPENLHTNWLSCFLVDPNRLGCTRDGLLEAVGARDIDARPVWKPMHMQPLYADHACFGGRVAEDLHARGLCLPSSSSLTEDEQDRVIEAVRTAVTQHTRMSSSSS